MKLLVTGLESSGTKWLTELLRAHPDVDLVLHTSIPEKPMPETGYPELNALDAIVWIVRYEPFRLLSVEKHGHNLGRPERFMPPGLYLECLRLIRTASKPFHFVGYESLVGPCGYSVFTDLLRRIGLNESRFPESAFNPRNGNAAYHAP